MTTQGVRIYWGWFRWGGEVVDFRGWAEWEGRRRCHAFAPGVAVEGDTRTEGTRNVLVGAC